MIDDLKRKAEAATPGKRQVDINGMRGKYTVWLSKEHEAKAADSDGVDGYSVSSANRDFIAACSPDAILRLVRVVEAAQTTVREALDSVEVHPCDVNDDSVRANSLHGPIRELYSAWLALEKHDA